MCLKISSSNCEISRDQYMVCVHFLKHKFAVFESFKMWKAIVENETGLKNKKHRTDNGG
ncbi:hypothetical protein MtrunA17_Chr1g0196701 [Medicago truncatula]|uniref:Uncharacterized protein n=1 Tax=Medicago truncatula TaxID=3880 RepID=A0A396JWP2_MEDTR|nr:hypothetical protein MtrunA17_Chr1g0196701 [Medicago truncatula]